MSRKLTQTKEDNLQRFNSAFNQLKEEFHRTGRFDDANTKLDEIIKLLIIKFFDIKNRTNKLSLSFLRKMAREQFGHTDFIAKTLQSLFSDVILKEKILNDPNGMNIFGNNPHLNIHPNDNNFVEKIVNTIEQISSVSKGSFRKFDLLNESFGHFVRDNFRNHKEDAQYMTPIEIVELMVGMAFNDILNDPIAKRNLFSKGKDDFFVLDPTCGVGTFLIGAAKKISTIIDSSASKNKNQILNIRNENSYLGQDKVDRMVRMSKINNLFNGLNANSIAQGNSILGHSFVDKYKGLIDLIITNPPFGAEFNFKELLDSNDKLEILPNIKDRIQTKTINSELIILDKSLKLLKSGGRLLIIVPDSVVSSQGTYEIYRKNISKRFILKAVIDLPSVTFAQAGTRTKCSILYLQKPHNIKKSMQNSIFMAVASSIGYEVKEKMGSPVKYYKGKNELEDIQKAYATTKKHRGTKVISDEPSAVLYPFDALINGKWNANFYNAQRIKVLRDLEKAPRGFETKTLHEIAQFVTKQRDKLPTSDKIKCISVLHIKENSTIQLEKILNYRPTCPGYECYPGEILFSKINPRIPRVIVVPNLDYKLTCSTEFEILRPFNDRYIYLLKIILLTNAVQTQINSLTSGTSSSHNRIKDTELMNIKIFWPKKNTNIEKQLLSLAKKIKTEEQKKYSANQNIQDTSQKIENLIYF